MRVHLPRCSHIWIHLAAVISLAVCKTCPPLKSDDMDIVCKYEDDFVSCENPMVRGTKAYLACKPSYEIPIGSDPGYRELTCLNVGVWDRSLFNCVSGDHGKISRKYCPELISQGVEFHCTSTRGNKTVPCTSDILPGTKATQSCKRFYHTRSDDPGYSEITCLENGQWDHTVFDCVPECGSTLPNGTELFDEGFPVERGTFPWSLTVYQKNSTSDWEALWGILISPDLVITQAYRIVNAAGGKILNPDNFAVIAGQYDSSYDVSELYSQRSFVKYIEISPGYVIGRRNYLHNLALIRLKTPFVMTELVRPICLDWDNRVTRETFENQKTEEVMESGNVTEGQDIKIPFYSNEECYERITDDAKKRMGNETFCTDCLIELDGYTLWDMANGFFQQSQGYWYLIGHFRTYLSSRNDSCSDYIQSFEKLRPYLDWIRTFYKASSR